MNRSKRIVLWVAGLAAAIVFIQKTAGPPPPQPDPPGTFSFAALGDAPYYAWEDAQYRVVLADLNANDLSFIIHVGDMFWRPCSDGNYRQKLGWYNAMRHPLILTPGDNEWFDCWEARSGGYRPLERLEALRKVFYSDPSRSLGGKALPLVSQNESRDFPEFVENARWVHEGIVFATVHLTGSWNGMVKFKGRTAADDDASKRRTVAAAAWLRETFAAARARGATALVVAFHGAVDFEEPPENRHRSTFEPFITTLEEEVEAFVKPVLVIHGDDHEYTVDHPLVRRTTGQRLENLTRLEVPGSPRVGWVRVIVTPGWETSFAFDEYVVPGWKYW